MHSPCNRAFVNNLLTFRRTVSTTGDYLEEKGKSLMNMKKTGWITAKSRYDSK